MARPVVVTTSDRRSSKAKPYVPSVAGASAAAPRRGAAPSSHMGGSPNLHAIARETKRRIRWDRVLRGAGSTRSGSMTGAQWKWLENVRNFSIYTKQSSALSSGYSVLAIGTIRASVSEVASLLASSSQPEFEQKMVALHDKEFRHAAYLGDLPTYSTHGDDDDDDDLASLSVRSVTFSRPRWLQRDDEWTFLEASQFDSDSQHFEKLLTTLALEDVLPQGRKARFTDAKPFRDIIAGYSVQPEDPSGSMSEPVDASSVSFSGVSPPCVRVHFYAELDAAPSSRGRLGRFVRAPGKHEASTKAMKQRMLTIAKDCDRLAQLVRRRRLGMQVLVDQRRVLPATNVTCVNCERNLLLGKLCRVCGQNVCGACSDTYERETHKLRSGRSMSHRSDTPLVRLENIRVCDPCLVRVEAADYSHLNDAALGGGGVFPNAPRKGSTVSTSVSEERSSTAAGDLKQLLHNALMDAPSTQRRGAVMNVIRCVLNQETDDTSVPPSPAMSTTSLHSNFEPVLLTPVSSDRDHLFALEKLDVPTTPFDEVETSDMEGRGYAVQPSANVVAPPPFPLTNTETERVQEIEKLGVLKSTEMSTELNIICDIAAKEMDAFATIVTILTADEQHVVGSNVAALEKMVVKREESFCQHTVMSDKPLIVPHPEADVRFSRILPVREMGVKYYCGFPITSGDDNTIIGALCCVDQKKHDITESQYSAMQRLAQTAGKVVKLQGKRHRTSSMATSSIDTPSAAPIPAPTKTEL